MEVGKRILGNDYYRNLIDMRFHLSECKEKQFPVLISFKVTRYLTIGYMMERCMIEVT